MGRKYVLVDDFDGKELPDDTKPITLSLGRTSYSLYLSEKNHGKLLEALTPFIENAETLSGGGPAPRSTGVGKGHSSVNDYGFDTKEVRAWAIANNVKQDNGNDVGERGRLSQGVYDAYRANQQK